MPIPNLLRKAVQITNKGDRIKNKLLMPYTTVKGDSTLYILARDGKSKSFTILAAVQNFGLEFDSQRNKPFVTYATNETNFGVSQDKSFGEIIAIASHVAILPQGDVFSIKEGTEIQVEQLDFSYRIYCRKVSDTFNPDDNQEA